MATKAAGAPQRNHLDTYVIWMFQVKMHEWAALMAVATVAERNLIEHCCPIALALSDTNASPFGRCSSWSPIKIQEKSFLHISAITKMTKLRRPSPFRDQVLRIVLREIHESQYYSILCIERHEC